MSLNISIQPTPNPNALKFIVVDHTLKAEGKVTYKTLSECEDNPMAKSIFKIRGVDTVHFFLNVVTVTKFNYEEWDNVEPTVMESIESHIETHDPNFKVKDPEADRRANLTPELKDIEEIIDRTIRPGLQADGGDMQCMSYTDDVLIVKYQGACGTCPSASTGTLDAIRSILKHEYNPEIEVYIAPEM